LLRREKPAIMPKNNYCEDTMIEELRDALKEIEAGLFELRRYL